MNDYFTSGAFARDQKIREQSSEIDKLKKETERVKRSVISSERIKEIECELIAQIKKEMMEKESELKEEYKKQLTAILTKEIWQKTAEELEKYKEEIKDKNSPILLPHLKIIIDETEYENTKRAEDYVKEKFEKMGFKVESTTRVGGGHPDFICLKDCERIFIEVKSYNDALRYSQAKWILENKDKNVIIYFVGIGIKKMKDAELMTHVSEIKSEKRGDKK